MNKRNQTKGITLIALIITIIVLLILAGVTISAITGNESVMEKAKEAKEKTDISNEKEAMQLAIINYRAENEYLSNMNQEKIASAISEYIESSESIVADEEHFDVTTKKGNEYIIKDDGTVLTIDELNKELDKCVDIKFTKTEKYDDDSRVFFYVQTDFLNESITVNETGVLLVNLTNDIEKDLTIENSLIDSSIYRNTYSYYPIFTFRSKDLGYGILTRLYAIIKYGKHEYVKYSEQIHVYYNDLD